MKKLALLLLCLPLFASCRQGPDVNVCLMDVKSAQLVCSDRNDNTIFVPFAEADGWIVMDPDDFKRVIDYIRLRCHK